MIWVCPVCGHRTLDQFSLRNRRCTRHISANEHVWAEKMPLGFTPLALGRIDRLRHLFTVPIGAG